MLVSRVLPLIFFGGFASTQTLDPETVPESTRGQSPAYVNVIVN